MEEERDGEKVTLQFREWIPPQVHAGTDSFNTYLVSIYDGLGPRQEREDAVDLREIINTFPS